jgi:pyrroloquinoline quinone biosynthesis protein B
MKLFTLIFSILVLFSCAEEECKECEAEIFDELNEPSDSGEIINPVQKVSLVILGNVQDAGSPHMACTKDCCKDLFENPDPNRKVVSLGLVDPENQKNYLFEATPDFTSQVKMLSDYSGDTNKQVPDGIFLTHAHIGHYTGLMYLGKEAMNADKVPVFAMPRMKIFLRENGPWSQLVANENILLRGINDRFKITLTPNVRVEPFLVPHRDEYSETVGYIITGPNKSALFIPDIDKWDKWETDIIEAVSKVDYAFLDGTFYDGAEINNRDISEIPHPFISESLESFKALSPDEKSKIYFIHFNHTNPVLIEDSQQSQEILDAGFNIANYKDVFEL